MRPTVERVFTLTHMAMSEAGHPSAPIFMNGDPDAEYSGGNWVGIRAESTAGERRAFWRAAALIGPAVDGSVPSAVCEECFVELRNRCEHVGIDA